MHTREIPEHILDQLLIGLVFHEAELTLEHFEPGAVALLGDAFGAVLGWLWQENPVKATLLVADLVAELRYHHHNATRAVGLEAVLGGLPACLRGVSPGEVAEIQEHLRRDVPRFVGLSDA